MAIITQDCFCTQLLGLRKQRCEPVSLASMNGFKLMHNVGIQPSQPANAVDSKMFWMALYAYPAAWIALLFVAILKL